MALHITSLNSGSNGNCYYVGNDTEAVLIDAGLSCRETEKRMARLSLSFDKVKAIFISHEHSDHIRGVPGIASKYNLPVYVTHQTLRHCPFTLDKSKVTYFGSNEDICIGGLCVTAFPKLHDASEPHSFVVSYNNIKVGVFTDIGAPCLHLTHHFKQCHAAFLEANYDEEMLDKGRYPIYLKNRIRGGKGHLSNHQAATFFAEHRSPNMQCLILAHLSHQNNCPKLVHQLFSAKALGTEVVVASRFKETAVYTIKNEMVPAYKSAINLPPKPVYQMTLF
ncbi:MAG TPA: MBL fold metallo-hydrolase [Chitinophagaceae bacterium]|nr:MBL fold metallo-hydrolase [Chitinophagaceae bacterium]